MEAPLACCTNEYTVSLNIHAAVSQTTCKCFDRLYSLLLMDVSLRKVNYKASICYAPQTLLIMVHSSAWDFVESVQPRRASSIARLKLLVVKMF